VKLDSIAQEVNCFKMIDPGALGVWISTLKAAAEVGAKPVRALLQKYQDDETCLTEEQKSALSKLNAAASASELVRAVLGDVDNAGGAFVQVVNSGGAGGSARSFTGAATGGAGGNASVDTSAATRRSQGK